MEIILRLQLMPIINSSYACTFWVWGKISAFLKYRHNVPSPVIAFFDVIYIKGIWEISDDIFI